MGWFSEQINERKLSDDEIFEDAFADMAGAVLGQKITRNLREQQIQAKDAIGEILKYYHIKPHELPENVTDPNDQLDMSLRPSGIFRRNVNLEAGWYKDAIGPMIGTRADNGQIVALLPFGFHGYCFVDHETGKTVRLNRRTAKLLEGEAIAFYKPFPQKKLGVPDLVGYMLGTLTANDLIAFVMFTAMVTLLGLLTPTMNKILFDTVIKMHSVQLLAAAGIFLICLTISTTLLNTAKTMVLARINTRLSMSIEAATMLRILSLPASFFTKYSSGELSSYVYNMNSLCLMLGNVFLSTGLTAVFSLTYILQIFNYAPILVIPVLCILLATVLMNILYTVFQARINRKKLQLGAKESGLTYGLLNGIQKIRLSGAEKRAFAKWAKLYSKEAEMIYNPPAFLKLNSVFQLAITSVGTLVIYSLAVKTNMSPSDYMAFNAAYGMVSGAFSMLASIVIQVAQVKPILDTARPLMDAQPECSEEKKAVERLAGGIELSHISFRYSESMPPVLNDLSLKIKPGQYVAVVGKTGCGKSTLVRLLLGFEKPEKGSVYYDGKDLQTLDVRSVRRKIGVVTQNGKLFQGDIYSNISISAPHLTMDEAWEAAEIAGIADDIRAMPMGMYTMISEGSGGISGGQKQRLMIARAVAPKPKVLIFDEATSALDNLTQKKVSEALDGLKCTRIVIAHRLSTIRHCDRILVLDGGQIIEDGTYDELIEQKGFFADLVERQRVE